MGLAAPTRAQVVLACWHSRVQQSGHVDSFVPEGVLPADPGIPFLETVLRTDPKCGEILCLEMFVVRPSTIYHVS